MGIKKEMSCSGEHRYKGKKGRGRQSACKEKRREGGKGLEGNLGKRRPAGQATVMKPGKEKAQFVG